MPGPVSDSYDPEFSTAQRLDEFTGMLRNIHGLVGGLIDAPPVDYRDLPDLSPGKPIEGCLSTRDWRFIRFALEFAYEGFAGEMLTQKNQP